MGITVGGQNFEDTGIDGQQSDIECSSSKIENKDVGFSSGLIHTVSDGRGGRFVDDTLDLHSGDGTSILGSLTLGIVEVSGDGDDSVLDVLAQESFGGGLHLLKDHGRNFFGGVFGLLSGDGDLDHRLVLVGDNVIRDKLLVGLNRFVGKFASDQTLDIKDGVFGVDGGLIFGGISDKTFGVVQEGNVGRSDTVTLVIGDNFDTSVLKDSNTRVGGSKIDTNDGSHGFLFFGTGGVWRGQKRQGGNGKLGEVHFRITFKRCSCFVKGFNVFLF
mmetsp:Transcript_28186/g.60463  ORF Transcript_28186/g.60463 Transcript_28186/m.60463 type:complete len:273 (-) Transcript_28186:55-873(-)